jgi:hypothetical protein
LGFGEDFGEFDGGAALLGADVGGFHEGVHLDGVLDRDGWFAGLEEFDDFGDEGGVVVGGGLLLGESGGAEDGDLVGEGFGAKADEGAGAAAGPLADDDVGFGGLGAGDGFAALAHDGVEGFGGMDSVPSEVGVVFFEMGGSIGNGAAHFADFGGLEFDHGGIPAVGAAGPDGDVGFAGEANDLEGVAEIGGDGFVDEDGLFCGEGSAELGEMGAAVDADDHDGIDVAGHGLDGVVELDAPFFAELFGVAFDGVGGGGDVGAVLFEGGDDFGAGNVVGGGGVVEDLGKGGCVGGVAADEAKAEFSGVSHERAGGEEEEERELHQGVIRRRKGAWRGKKAGHKTRWVADARDWKMWDQKFA